MRRTILVFVGFLMFGSYYGYDAIAPLADTLQRAHGFTDTQIGALNAIYSLPNIGMVLIGGLLVDRFGAGRVILGTATVCFGGALLTAARGDFTTMAAGRLLFGLGAETMLIATTTAIGLWFEKGNVAFAMALSVSIARAGSFAADVSPTWASALYEQGWRAPLLLAAAFSGLGVVGAIGYRFLERRAPDREAGGGDRVVWRDVFRFDRSYVYVVALCVLFYSVIFPFRSTFAVKYYQHAHGMSLEEASTTNSFVFLAAVFATPLFGYLSDRIGRRAVLLVVGSALLPVSFAVLQLTDWSLWIVTVLIGISFSLVPAVLWPSVTRLVEGKKLGTAFGLMAMLQNVGLTTTNLAAGAINDAAGAGADHPEAYTPMIVFFGVLSLGGVLFAAALARREGARDRRLG